MVVVILDLYRIFYASNVHMVVDYGTQNDVNVFQLVTIHVTGIFLLYPFSNLLYL